MASWVPELAEQVIKGNASLILDHIYNFFEEAKKDPSFALALALDSISSGVAMLVDDFKDFVEGRFDRLHHYHYGLILLGAGLLAFGGLLFWLWWNSDNKEVIF